MDVLVRLQQIIEESTGRSLNEADTRHRVIDFVVHDFLSWPRNRVACEEYVRPGYADFVLKKSNEDSIILIEAKREGFFFDLPVPYKDGELSAYVSIKKLLTDDNIQSAMMQVREYCFNTGCEFACITNGHEWIFFKIFERGKRWDDLQAFVVRSLSFFADRYTAAINSLSYTAITERAALLELLSSAPPKDRPIFYPKEKVPAHSHPISPNRLAGKLRPVVKRYFGVISDADTEFMDRCYVSQPEYQATTEGMRALMQDSLTPYFEDYGVQQLQNTGHGGQLGGRLTKHIKKERKGEVLVLFGGKGSGKSTFLKRLLHHQQPRWLRDHALVCLVDLLKVPDDEQAIKLQIWRSLIDRLDVERVLDSDRDQLIHRLFADRFEVARKQDLAGLSRNSEVYNLRLNDLVSGWKRDHVYCAKRLAANFSESGQGIIVVVDNTDQYRASTQDACFTLAQEISSELDCVVLISMREERFYNSKVHGTLDAFQNSGFHISSPKPSEVFRKRLDYTAELLHRNASANRHDSKPVEDAAAYLRILSREFGKDQSPLNRFLSASAHGDIRLSLDLFSSFLLSGYTNVDEMISAGAWNFQIHQVVKPVMSPSRFFYDESLSDIPNIYQVRSVRHGSHFTALRILRKLSKGGDPTSPAYFSMVELRSYFIEVFQMQEDFEQNLDMLLKRGFVEANNRIDYYSENLDTIRITSYGSYVYSELAYDFTYLDLVCTDCGVFSETISNYLVAAARTEYKQFMAHQRSERVQTRIERVNEFINYLAEEEQAERDRYGLTMPLDEMFTARAAKAFEDQKDRALKSLKKQKYSKNGWH